MFQEALGRFRDEFPELGRFREKSPKLGRFQDGTLLRTPNYYHFLAGLFAASGGNEIAFTVPIT